MNRIILVIVLVFVRVSAYAQTDAILWKISGNDIKTPSYLFGTIHAHCNYEKIFTAELTKAIQSSNLIVLEMDLNDFSTIVAMSKAAMKEIEKPISSYMTAEEYKLVDEACQNLLGDSLKVFDNRSPMVLLSRLMISDSIASCQIVPLDLVVAEFSKQLGIPLKGLETFGFQDSLLHSATDSIQTKWLIDFCKDLKKSKEDFSALQKVYDQQSSSELYKTVLSMSKEVEFNNEVFLDKRNINWMNILQPEFAKQSTFVAVGAAHLGGENGLLNLLKKAGYTLTPITLTF